jgi:hypothetical protein
MYLLTALVLVAFPFLAEASSLRDTSKTGLSIPLSKRSVLHSIDGAVDITKVHASRHHTIAYVSLFSSRDQLNSLLAGALEKSSADSILSRKKMANPTLLHQNRGTRTACTEGNSDIRTRAASLVVRLLTINLASGMARLLLVLLSRHSLVIHHFWWPNDHINITQSINRHGKQRLVFTRH